MRPTFGVLARAMWRPSILAAGSMRSPPSVRRRNALKNAQNVSISSRFPLFSMNFHDFPSIFLGVFHVFVLDFSTLWASASLRS